MISNTFFKQTDILAKSLDASSLRNEVIMSNIANNDTPNYKKRTVSFEAAFQDALDRGKRTGELNLNTVSPQVEITHGNYELRMDGNNVDIEQEMTELYKNSLRYEVMVGAITSNSQRMQTVLTSR